MKPGRIAWSIVGVLSLSTAARALDPIAILSPSDVPAGYGNGFGLSVAISGDYLVIGAPWDPWYNGTNWGAAYVFRREGRSWIEQAKLTPPDPPWQGQFGWSVGIDGDVIVAGAPHYFPTYRYDGGPGAAYVFRRDDHGTPDDPTDDTWPQEAKLTAPNRQLGQLLGISVAISGDVIVAGKPRVGDSAEVFRWNPGPPGQWSHEATLIGSDTPADWDEFGWSVDIDGDKIVVGAYGHDERRGAAYVFLMDGTSWVEDAKLIAADAAAGDFFGFAVSTSSNVVSVGAPGDNLGSGYFFASRGPGEWTEEDKVVSPDPPVHGDFGYSVSIDADLVVIGRWADPGDPWGLLFRRKDSLWREAYKLFGPAGYPPRSVALNGKYAAVWGRVYAVRERRTLQDYAAFQNCFGGNCTEGSVSCKPFDLTHDGRVDLADFEEFVGTFVGPET